MIGQQLTAGATVYDRSGKTVGTLQAYNAQSRYLTVRTHRLFRRKDLYIPYSAVLRSDAWSVSLHLTRRDLTAAHYDFAWPQGDHPGRDTEHLAAFPGTVMAAGADGGSGTTTQTAAAGDSTPPVSPAAPRFFSLDD